MFERDKKYSHGSKKLCPSCKQPFHGRKKGGTNSSPYRLLNMKTKAEMKEARK
jgi:hypothetical protein